MVAPEISVSRSPIPVALANDDNRHPFSLEAALVEWDALPRPRVLTNGVFDLLHRGHCELLREARSLGGALAVAVNSDASARRLCKGPGRPFNIDFDRATVLAALRDVDLVLLFDEDTPCETLAALRPEIYVKGGDYDVARLPEAALMAQWGGRALALRYQAGLSSTGIAKRILAAHAAEPLLAGAPA
jgi:rfaE bifunctional protein nucleotidyltransferase chain/domain